MHSSMKFMLVSVFPDYGCSNSTCNLPILSENPLYGLVIIVLLVAVASRGEQILCERTPAYRGGSFLLQREQRH